MNLGYGGNLIWSGVLKEIHLNDKVKPIVCLMPKISDLICGSLYDRYSSLKNDPIFKYNPRILFSSYLTKKKPIYWRLLDVIFIFLIRPNYIHSKYENYIFKLSKKKYEKYGTRLVHINMRIHSYALGETKNRIIWKSGGHATQIIARRFGVKCNDPDCELTFSKKEDLQVNQLINLNKLKKFIVIDPNSNQDWFGFLRSWPINRWQKLINQIIRDFPDIKIIQIGLKNGDLLSNVIDLRGKTNFRQASIMIKKSLFFIGTEGGLMHAARAVKARAIIIWGGLTLPEFAGYPVHQKVICKYVSCAPCGNLGWCNNDHKCMNNINVEEVYKEVSSFLKSKYNEDYDK